MTRNAAVRRGSARNATFSLHAEALEAIDDLVAAGRAPSKNALIEALVLKERRRLARERRHHERLHAYEEAMRDPMFVRDLKDVESAFATADAETARAIE
ncbi:MAG: hypothetical protein HY332_10290 [Chloroflexi bacterium]|nr:hypothetical protein [Chloroflexota bacterium]